MTNSNLPASVADDKRIMLIVNPISGTGNKKDVPEVVERTLAAEGYSRDCSVCRTLLPPALL